MYKSVQGHCYTLIFQGFVAARVKKKKKKHGDVLAQDRALYQSALNQDLRLSLPKRDAITHTGWNRN